MNTEMIDCIAGHLDAVGLAGEAAALRADAGALPAAWRAANALKGRVSPIASEALVGVATEISAAQRTARRDMLALDPDIGQPQRMQACDVVSNCVLVSEARRRGLSQE